MAPPASSGSHGGEGFPKPSPPLSMKGGAESPERRGERSDTALPLVEGHESDARKHRSVHDTRSPPEPRSLEQVQGSFGG